MGGVRKREWREGPEIQGDLSALWGRLGKGAGPEAGRGFDTLYMRQVHLLPSHFIHY